MADERAERCDLCRFYDDVDPEGKAVNGLCRRYPPCSVDRNGEDYWAHVSRNDWCGEFRAREADPPAAVLTLRELDLPSMAITALEDGWVIDGPGLSRVGWTPVRNAGELCRRTARELLALRGFGKLSLLEARRALARHGLALCGDTPQVLRRFGIYLPPRLDPPPTPGPQ